MKSIGFLILCISLLVLSSNSFAQEKRLKVMQWNIWGGGKEGYPSNKFEVDTANVANTIAVIKNADPDIMTMTETYCCGMEIAKEAGLKYSARASSNLSIHSKYPIKKIIKVFHSFNSFGVVLDIDGKEIICFNIWLNYLPDFINDMKHQTAAEVENAERSTRYKEAVEILKEISPYLSNSEKVPILMCGDFNSPSFKDWSKSSASIHGDKIIKWPASVAMDSVGLKDSFRELYPDPTKDKGFTYESFSSMVKGDRIDYIFYKGNALRPINSEVIRDAPEGFHFNSDHCALKTTFILDL